MWVTADSLETETVSNWITFVDLTAYKDNTYDENADPNCKPGRGADNDKYCRFDVNTLENCSPGKTDRKYGFPEKKPCIFLKLNKVSTE